MQYGLSILKTKTRSIQWRYLVFKQTIQGYDALHLLQLLVFFFQLLSHCDNFTFKLNNMTCLLFFLNSHNVLNYFIFFQLGHQIDNLFLEVLFLFIINMQDILLIFAYNCYFIKFKRIFFDNYHGRLIVSSKKFTLSSSSLGNLARLESEPSKLNLK